MVLPTSSFHHTWISFYAARIKMCKYSLYLEREFVKSYKKDELNLREYFDIAKAIYLDDAENLKNLITNGML